MRILIVDDDVDDRQIMDLAFKEANLGHTITFVKNGEELMFYLHHIHNYGNSDEMPDLILLDLNMPKKDGRVALKEIRSDENFRNLNIIVFSTTISNEDFNYISELGVIKCITKPCGFYELVNIIRDVSEHFSKSYPRLA